MDYWFLIPELDVFSQMIGISFHVGSGCMDAPIYGKAIKIARKLFDFAENVGYEFKLLDIGGGFPGDTNTDIKEVKLQISSFKWTSKMSWLMIGFPF